MFSGESKMSSKMRSSSTASSSSSMVSSRTSSQMQHRSSYLKQTAAASSDFSASHLQPKHSLTLTLPHSPESGSTTPDTSSTSGFLHRNFHMLSPHTMVQGDSKSPQSSSGSSAFSFDSNIVRSAAMSSKQSARKVTMASSGSSPTLAPLAFQQEGHSLSLPPTNPRKFSAEGGIWYENDKVDRESLEKVESREKLERESMSKVESREKMERKTLAKVESREKLERESLGKVESWEKVERGSLAKAESLLKVENGEKVERESLESVENQEKVERESLAKVESREKVERESLAKLESREKVERENPVKVESGEKLEKESEKSSDVLLKPAPTVVSKVEISPPRLVSTAEIDVGY